MAEATVIEQPRFLCALGGQQTVLAIERAIPIVHAGPGCVSKIGGGLSFASGYQGSGYAGGSAVPCTNTGEREVVLGGEARLREVIDGALKVMKGDLFVVLTGCTAEIVGDDTPGVVSEYAARGVPIVSVLTGGFKGTSLQGHEMVVQAIASQALMKADRTEENLVNVLSVVPYQDPFWRGNLEGIRRLLAGIGLEANMLFGFGSGGFDAWKRIPRARFNLVLSPWVGLRAADTLSKKFGTPFLHWPVLPIGAFETGRFLRAVGNYAGVAERKVEAYIGQQESRFYSFLEGAADFLLEARYDLPGRFFTISDAAYSLGISRFLVNDLGLLPGRQYVTDGVPEEHHARISGLFGDLGQGVSAEVAFMADGGAVREDLLAYPHRHQPLIVGSSWDRDVARRLHGFHLSVGLPATDRLILDRSYIGYDGGLALAEDLYTSVLGSYQ